MDAVAKILEKYGPSRSSLVVEHLKKDLGISAEAARQRLSRAKDPIMKFPIQLLPNNEKFIYLRKQRSEELFWTKFHKALRETNSVYGAAIDGLANRGGVVEISEFAVISGAPIALKGQVCVNRVASNLLRAQIIEEKDDGDVKYYSISKSEIFAPNSDYKILSLAENVILDGVREWARKLGLASYHKIAIRGDVEKRQVGAFMWDLTGPSYILHLKSHDSKRPGFLVSDVFVQKILNENDIKFFIKKVQLSSSSTKKINIFPVLVAEGFDKSALDLGKRCGIVMISIENLFGYQVARSIRSLIETLRNAAAIAVSNPDKIISLIENLGPIEGAAGNLRGILFELLSLRLAGISGSVDHAFKFLDPKTGVRYDIDILQIVNKRQIVAIECKGRNPGGGVDLEEVEKWLRRVPIYKSYLSSQDRFKGADISFEIWTTGNFNEDAKLKLEERKKNMTKTSIKWKNGHDIVELAKTVGENGIVKALKEHFLKHPLTNLKES